MDLTDGILAITPDRPAAMNAFTATMPLPMDLRLANDAARFGLVLARRGVLPELGPSW